MTAGEALALTVRRAVVAASALALAGGLAACGGSSAPRVSASDVPAAGLGAAPSRSGASRPGDVEVPRPGAVPPALNANDVYAADRAGRLSPVVRGDPALVYVPNSESNTVDVIYAADVQGDRQLRRRRAAAARRAGLEPEARCT